jgi:hypothetical protein
MYPQLTQPPKLRLFGEEFVPNSKLLLTDNHVEFRVVLVKVRNDLEHLVVQRQDDGSQSRIDYDLLRDGRVRIKHI